VAERSDRSSCGGGGVVRQAQTPRIACNAALPDSAWVRGITDRIRDAQRRGYIFPDHHVEGIDRALQVFGFARAAPSTQ